MLVNNSALGLMAAIGAGDEAATTTLLVAGEWQKKKNTPGWKRAVAKFVGIEGKLDAEAKKLQAALGGGGASLAEEVAKLKGKVPKEFGEALTENKLKKAYRVLMTDPDGANQLALKAAKINKTEIDKIINVVNTVVTGD